MVINADDFGLSEEVNDAVEVAHRDGILSAASLMVGGAAAADALARARRLPNLRVGLHLVLVDGDPVSDPARIPGLVDNGGRLRNDLGRVGARIMFDRALRQQVATEIAAQFKLFRASGLSLDHVDAHRHFHLHPVVAALAIAVGRDYGMRALRIPIEPRHIVTAIDPRARGGTGIITSPWAALLRRRARRAALAIPDAVFGLAWSGAMNTARLAALLGRLPPGFVEIYLHPATTDSFAGAAPGYRYSEEFTALCSAECMAALRRSGRRNGGYADVGTA